LPASIHTPFYMNNNIFQIIPHKFPILLIETSINWWEKPIFSIRKLDSQSINIGWQYLSSVIIVSEYHECLQRNVVVRIGHRCLKRIRSIAFFPFFSKDFVLK
jgi:hypothetical protein